MSAKILVIDDDIHLINALESLLSAAGYQPIPAHTAEDGYQQALKTNPDLAIVDVMVPVMGGWEVCRQLRAVSEIPILFLTALGNVEHLVRGLEMGADDYLVKPFKHEELLARIKAHLRRTQNSKKPGRLVFGNGDLVVDFLTHQIVVRGQTVELTPREFELLAVLARSPGRVITTRELLRQAWGPDYETPIENIKPYIHYLRRKIEEDPAAPRWLLTVRGIGYRFNDSP